MDENFITLKLKTPMSELDGTPVKIIDQIKNPMHPDGRPMTVPELKEHPEAKVFTFGFGLAKYLMYSVPPSDPEEMALVNRWSRKISNTTFTDKAELKVDRKDLEEILKLLGKIKIDASANHLLGDITNWLMEAKEELIIQSKGK